MNCPNCKHNLPANARFCPNCGTSIQRASTIDYSELIAERTQDFTGREWLLRQLNEWLAHGTERVFLLTGGPGPGSGKTAAAARLVQMSQGQVSATDYPHLGQGVFRFFHFCQALDDRTLNPRRFVEALSLALASRYPIFAQALIQTPDTSIVIRQKVGSVSSGGQVIGVSIESLHIGTLSARVAFDRIVRRPLEQLCTSNFDETILILVDALDEALTYPDENILTLLSRRAGLPPQVRFVLTSRPDQRVLDMFGKPTLDLINDAPDNQDDVVAYAHRRLHTLAEPKRTELAERIATAGAGNFLYACYVLDDLLADEKQDLDPATLSLPAGLDDIYRQFLQRQFPATSSDWKKHYRPLLGALAVARGSGLTRSQLGGIMSYAHQLPQSQTDDFLQACAQYLAAPHPDGPFRIYHHSFRDFLLTDRPHQIYPSEANQAIADFFVKEYQSNWLNCKEEYALTYTPIHLIEAINNVDKQGERQKVVDTLVRLLRNYQFRKAKSKQLGEETLLDDLDAALELSLSWLKRWQLERYYRRHWFNVLRSGVSVTPDKIEKEEIKITWQTESEIVPSHTRKVVYANVRGMSIVQQSKIVMASPEAVYSVFAGLGGKQGWLYANWAWRVWGMIDDLIGGVGFRYGRRDPDTLQVGDSVDFWRVEEIIPDKLLRLESEMNIPGRFWLQFEATPKSESETLLILTTFFAPKSKTFEINKRKKLKFNDYKYIIGIKHSKKKQVVTFSLISLFEQILFPHFMLKISTDAEEKVVDSDQPKRIKRNIISDLISGYHQGLIALFILFSVIYSILWLALHFELSFLNILIETILSFPKLIIEPKRLKEHFSYIKYRLDLSILPPLFVLLVGLCLFGTMRFIRWLIGS